MPVARLSLPVSTPRHTPQTTTVAGPQQPPAVTSPDMPSTSARYSMPPLPHTYHRRASSRAPRSSPSGGDGDGVAAAAPHRITVVDDPVVGGGEPVVDGGAAVPETDGTYTSITPVDSTSLRRSTRIRHPPQRLIESPDFSAAHKSFLRSQNRCAMLRRPRILDGSRQ